MIPSIWVPAHPRVCGENGDGVDDPRGAGGSSPRVRGKHHRLVRVAHRGRLIPACAGKTGPRTAGRYSCGAHPRVCGENGVGDSEHCMQSGSSPRVRGKHLFEAGLRPHAGLIPACAGKTQPRSPSPGGGRAHPRVCGENRPRPCRMFSCAGSSPRVRGKPREDPQAGAPAGLIPACAGKTWRSSNWCSGTRAHPRVCGENRGECEPPCLSRGSSPRVRGKHFLTWAFTAQAGQILETLGPSAFSGSYSFPGARANGGQCRARRRGLCTSPALGRPLGAS